MFQLRAVPLPFHFGLFFGLYDLGNKLPIGLLKRCCFWKCAYADSCTQPSARELTLTQMQVPSFFRACWPLQVGLEMGCLVQEQGVRAASPLLSDRLCCTEGGTLPHVAGVDALRVGLSWLYSAWFSSCLSAPGNCPWAEKGCGQGGPCRLSARVSNNSASRIRCAARSGFCTGFPHPTQGKPWVQVHGSLTDNRLSPASATHTLFWCHTARQAMRVCIPRVYLGVSCGGEVALRDLSCFKCATWVGASKTHCHPNQGPAPGLDSL